MERAIQETDNDAFACKVSAVAKKYLPSPEQVRRGIFEHYEDMYLEFCREIKSVSRRKYGNITRTCQQSFPVMNYGTYLRTVSIDLKLIDWLEDHMKASSDRVQVINLGCGSDLRMVNFLSEYPGLEWLDLDYKDVVSFKAQILSNNANFRSVLKITEGGSTSIVTDRYQLLPCNIVDRDELKRFLGKYTDPQIPTVVLTECVLCYLSDADASSLISVITSCFSEGCWISYDPIGGSDSKDRFGSIMQENLMESRQLSMPTLMVYNSKDKYMRRFPGDCQIMTMWEYYQTCLDEAERQRLKTLQFLDEIEELQVIFSHYVISTAKWDKNA